MSINTAPAFIIGDGQIIPEAGFVIGYDSYPFYCTDAMLLADGKVLAAGYTNSPGSTLQDFGLVRYNANGTLDTSFSGDGWLTTDIGTYYNVAWTLTTQSDGKILVAGYAATHSDSGDDRVFAIVRYNTDGTLDNSFSSDGIATTDMGGDDIVRSVKVQADGKILVAGSSINSPYFELARYNADGSLDTGFGSGGKVHTNLGEDSYFYGESITLQSDGKILFAGTADAAGEDGNFALVRYTTNGSLDSTFNGGGIAVVDFFGADEEANSAAVQSDGKILVAGYAYDMDGDCGFAIARFNANGTLDATFSGGEVVTYFGDWASKAYSITVQSDGKILVAGEVGSASGTDFALVRYNVDGTRDTGFSGDGMLTTDFGGSDVALRVTALSDGKIVVLGRSSAGEGPNNFVYARYNADGSLDSTLDKADTLQGVKTFTEGGAATDLDSHLRIFDAELDALNGGYGNYNGATLTLQRHGGANADDVFTGAIGLNIGAQGGSVELVGTTFGTATVNSNGMLTITFNANATSELVNQLVPRIYYSNTSDAPPESVVIDWTFSDGNTGSQGTGGAFTCTSSTSVTISAVNDAPVLNFSTTTTFATRTNYSAGSNPTAVASADVNGDGKLDLIAINGILGGNASVWLGDGNGAFGTRTTYGVGSNPLDISSVDLNNDDMADLIVANNGSNTVSVLLNNGDGTFAAQTAYPVGSGPGSMISLDLNGDGYTDLVTSNTYSKNVSVLLNNGNGTFAAQTSYAVGLQPRSVIGADVNGDGVMDLITANYKDNNFSLLLGNGDGTFAAQTSIAPIAQPYGLIISDVNSDGEVDLITTNFDFSDHKNISVFLGNGNGTFDAPTSYAVIGNGVGLVAADINLDGKIDLITNNGNGNSVIVLPGSGDGTFTEQTAIAAGALPMDIISADMNGDGQFDLITANYSSNNVSVLLNTSIASYTENGAAVVLKANASVSDVELSSAGNYAGASITLARGGGANTQDVFSGSGSLSIVDGGNVTLGATVIGTAVNQGGTLTITFNANATQAAVNTTLSSIKYSNSSDTPPVSVQVNWTFNDGNSGEQGEGGALQATGSTTVTIKAVNDNPAANADAASTDEDETLAIAKATLLANDSDVEGDSLTLASVQNAVHGTVVADGDNIVFIPDTNYCGEASFTYTVSDGHGGSSTTTVNVTVDAVNDAPTGAVVISGMPVSGQTLTANTATLVDADGMGTLHYQWQADGADIVGAADSSRFTLTEALIGKVINVVVRYTDGWGVDESMTSSATAAVVEGVNDITGTALANVLNGTAGKDAIYGLAGNDILKGLAGNDLLDGGLGTDTMIGGAGNDTYVISSNSDVVTEGLSADIDTVKVDFTKADTYIVAANVEIATVDADFAINLTGNALANILTGNDLVNVLSGAGGGDFLYGLGGNDSLNGGGGADNMNGGAGDDTYTVDNELDIIHEDADAGVDVVKVAIAAAGKTYVLSENIENSTIVSTVDGNLTGNAGDNTLTGNAYANIIFGADGNDIIKGGGGNDVLIGGEGNDSMYGGAGNDIYIVDSTDDKVYETTTAIGTTDATGVDTVVSSVHWTLGLYVEKLTLAEGAGAIDGTGNALANTIKGNEAANVLDGGLGNDTINGGAGNDSLIGGTGADKLIGGVGNDVLTGGAGADIFVFNADVDGDSNVDVIADFVHGVDKIQLENAIFGRLTVTGVLGAGKFHSGGADAWGAADANDYVLYDTSTGDLYYDETGNINGHEDAVKIATLTGAPAITVSDFVVI